MEEVEVEVEVDVDMLTFKRDMKAGRGQALVGAQSSMCVSYKEPAPSHA